MVPNSSETKIRLGARNVNLSEVQRQMPTSNMHQCFHPDVVWCYCHQSETHGHLKTTCNLEDLKIIPSLTKSHQLCNMISKSRILYILSQTSNPSHMFAHDIFYCKENRPHNSVTWSTDSYTNVLGISILPRNKPKSSQISVHHASQHYSQFCSAIEGAQTMCPLDRLQKN